MSLSRALRLKDLSAAHAAIMGRPATLDSRIAALAGVQPIITGALNINQAWVRGAPCAVAAIPGWGFTRALAAYGERPDLTLQPFASGAPRLVPGRGQLIEGARTNLCLRSQEFDNASWTKSRSSVSANAATAPDGTLTADKLVEDSTATSTHRAYQAVSKAASPVTYTGSVYLKAGERAFARLKLSDNTETDNASVGINLLTGELGTAAGSFTSISATSSLLADGWVRVTLSATSDSDTQIVLFVFTSTGLTVPDASYSGDGASGIYVWGAQLEAASFASSYIPTTTTSVTRPADIPLIDLLAPLLYDVSAQPELVSNGAFASGSSWTLGTGWAISGGMAVATATAVNAFLQQNISATSGTLYYITYTITRTSGDLRVRVGGVVGATRSASGTYTEVIRATGTGNLGFDAATTAFTGTIDDVSVKAVPASQVINYPLTMYARFERVVDTGGSESIIVVDANSSSDRALLFVDSSDRASLLVTTASVAQANPAVTGALAVNQSYRAAGRIASNDVQMAAFGTLATADTSSTNPASPSVIRLGVGAGGANQGFLYLSEFAIIPGAVSDANLPRLAPA